MNEKFKRKTKNLGLTDDKQDLVAQLVEHDTFNVGVLGSSLSGVTMRGISSAG